MAGKPIRLYSDFLHHVVLISCRRQSVLHPYTAGCVWRHRNPTHATQLTLCAHTCCKGADSRLRRVHVGQICSLLLAQHHLRHLGMHAPDLPLTHLACIEAISL